MPEIICLKKLQANVDLKHENIFKKQTIKQVIKQTIVKSTLLDGFRL